MHANSLSAFAIALLSLVPTIYGQGDGHCNPFSPACVEIYTQPHCPANEPSFTNFVPNCDGSCISFGTGFTSADLKKGVFSNVDCALYSDSSCTNVIPGAEHVENTCVTVTPSNAANSLRCYFAC